MKELTSTNICVRAEDLVTYLYGEATRDEAKDFEQHTRSCSSCRTEVAAFGEVRQAVGEWRRQALSSLTSPAVQPAHRFAPAQTRSPLAALREFFNLSPTWMRAATGFAAVLFCALAVIAVVYFVQGPRTPIVEKQGEQLYSEKEVEAKIAAALKKQNEMRAQEAPPPSPQSVTVADNEEPEVHAPTRRNASAARQLAKNNRRQQKVPRANERPVKMELASTDYLPFTAPMVEEKLPSLADLVDEDD